MVDVKEYWDSVKAFFRKYWAYFKANLWPKATGAYYDTSDFIEINWIALLVITLFIALIYAIYKYVKVFLVADFINAWEIRLYVWAGLVIAMVICFSVMRIYNAVYANTTILIRLGNELKAFSHALKIDREKVTAASAKIRDNVNRLAVVIATGLREFSNAINSFKKP